MRRFGTGDAMIGLGLLALILSALLPSYRARSFDQLVTEAASDVDLLRGSAERRFRTQGQWPRTAPAGVLPPGTSGSFQGDSTLARERYSVQWRLWERVEYVVAPPTAGPVVFDADETPPDPEALVPGDLPPDSVGPELAPSVQEHGSIVVYSKDDLLLAALLNRFGAADSFVRDSIWTLVVPIPGS